MYIDMGIVSEALTSGELQIFNQFISKINKYEDERHNEIQSIIDAIQNKYND